MPVGFIDRIHVSSLYFMRCWIPGKIVLKVIENTVSSSPRLLVIFWMKQVLY